MDNNNSLASQGELKAASFNGICKETYQIQLVVGLIKHSIENECPITIEDIIGIYASYKERVGGMKKEINSGRKTPQGWIEWIKVPATREEFVKLYYTKIQARQWFKSNLGAAIIKGKLLIIPVIEIE